jgi:hypothetical protein
MEVSYFLGVPPNRPYFIGFSINHPAMGPYFRKPPWGNHESAGLSTLRSALGLVPQERTLGTETSWGPSIKLYSINFGPLVTASLSILEYN